MSEPKVALIPMICPRCQQPVKAQPDEVVWVCQTCAQGLVLSDEQGLLPQVVHYAPGIPPNSPGKPVWVAAGQVTLRRETYSGDESREMLQFWSTSRWFYVPAYTLALDQLVDAGVRFLVQPLPRQEIPTPSPFLPVTVHPEDVRPLAEFIILAVEAGRRDKLRSLEFNLQIGAAELWIFP